MNCIVLLSDNKFVNESATGSGISSCILNMINPSGTSKSHNKNFILNKSQNKTHEKIGNHNPSHHTLRSTEGTIENITYEHC